MKKTFFVMLITAFFLDYSFLPMIQPGTSASANFVLIVLAIILMKRTFSESVGWIILGGLLLDYVSSTPLGTNVLAFLLVGIGLEAFQKKLSTSMPSAMSLLMIFFTVFVLFEGILGVIIGGARLIGAVPLIHPIQIKSIPSFLVFKLFLSFIGVLLFNFIDKLEWLAGAKPVELKVDSDRA